MSIYHERPRPQKFCPRRRRLADAAVNFCNFRHPPGNELIILRACVCGGEISWMPVAAIIGDFLICVYTITRGCGVGLCLVYVDGPVHGGATCRSLGHLAERCLT